MTRDPHARALGAHSVGPREPYYQLGPGLRGLIGGNGLRGGLEGAVNRRAGFLGTNARSEEAPGSEGGEIDWFDDTTFTDTVNPLQEGQEVRIGEFTVPAQTGYVFGFGVTQPGKAENQGTIYFDPNGATVTANPRGWLRLRSENAVGKDQDDHGRLAVARLAAPAADTPTEWHKFPERDMPVVEEDSVLYLTFEANAATWDGEDFTLSSVADLTMAMTQFTEG